MKRYRFWLLGAFVLVTALLVGATIKARQNPLYQLAHYPQTPALTRYIFDLSSEMEIPFAVGEPVLDIHEPENGNFKRVLSYEVNGGGQFKLNVLLNQSGSGGYFQQADLTAAQFATVQKLMRQLPPSSAPTRREDLIVVLFNDPAPAQLRLYDRKRLPPQIGAIIGILTAAMKKDLSSLLPGQTVRDLPHLRSKLRSDSQRVQN